MARAEFTDLRSAEEIRSAALIVRKRIDRLWNTYTSVSEIRTLYRQLEIATDNELRRVGA